MIDREKELRSTLFAAKKLIEAQEAMIVRYRVGNHRPLPESVMVVMDRKRDIMEKIENAIVMEKPEGYEDEVHGEYLNELRESGVTNMFGAGPYLVAEFGLTRDEAKAYLIYWMKTFSREE